MLHIGVDICCFYACKYLIKNPVGRCIFRSKSQRWQAVITCIAAVLCILFCRNARGEKRKKRKKKRTNKCITLPFCLSSLPRQSGMLFPQSKKASFGKDSRNLKVCISNGAVTFLWASKQFMPRIVPQKEKRKNKERRKERNFKKLISCGKSASSNQKGLIKLATNHRKR